MAIYYIYSFFSQISRHAVSRITFREQRLKVGKAFLL